MMTDAEYVDGIRVIPAGEALSMVDRILGDDTEQLSSLVVGVSVERAHEAIMLILLSEIV